MVLVVDMVMVVGMVVVVGNGCEQCRGTAMVESGHGRGHGAAWCVVILFDGIGVIDIMNIIYMSYDDMNNIYML
jgi:hypothetical protein|eukprot:COSAG01_NODE_526_length_15908_cov_6.178063_11_plen_74_part_00